VSVPPDAPNGTAQVPPEASQLPAQPADAQNTEEPTRVAGLVPAQYADLFDRMRSGFRLKDDPERRVTEQELNWYVNNPDYLERAFGRSEHYLYHIVTELEARGMPLEIALLPVVESAFEPYAYSHARASGLWQFIPDTGSRFGLKQDWWYDGRRDVVESTRAALDYLDSLHDEFNGDWLLAIAAYNCGELAVEHAIEVNRELGLPTGFWDLRLPKETRAYVPKLLAMKRLVATPESYGLSISPVPNQPYFVQVQTKGQISLKLAAEIAGITPEELYELNPAYHRWATDPVGPNKLLLPADAVDAFNRNIGELTDEERLGCIHYRVRSGDSVASVAQHFHTTVNVIRELNDLPQGRLTVGNDVLIPSKVSLPAKVLLAASRIDRPGRLPRRWHVQIVRSGETLWSIARRHGMNVNTLANLNGMRPNTELRAGQKLRLSSASGNASEPRPTRATARRVVYTVRAGDTLTQIARLFQVSVAQIMSWNGMHGHSPVQAGQRLTIRLASRRS
jgi:membrane-bound lytic murein transglycosylase D